MNSIRLGLLKRLAGPILLIHLVAAVLTYLLAWTPAQLAFDEGLADTAAGLAARVHVDGGRLQLDLPPAAEQALRRADTGATWFAVRGPGQRLVAGDPRLGAGKGAGLYDAVVGGEPVRVAVAPAGPGAQVSVARSLRPRQQVRDAVVRSLVLLESLFALALVGVVWFSLSNGLAPLTRLRTQLDHRGSADLDALDETGMPDELLPVVGAFNRLLARVQASARAQDEFLANAAHQLRTPLAGVKLQLEWLATRHAADPESMHAVGLMLQANGRLIRQVNQLLALARAEPSRFARVRGELLDLNALVADAVQPLVEQAHARRIDLGFELAPAPVAGDRFLLRDVIDNLVDNALRYTPAGGAVTVRCLAGLEGSVLVVEDTGPGVPPSQRERVFERFVRLDEQVAGSGLGLSIVREIALAHGATVALEAGEGGAGARFTVCFPAV